MTSTPPMSPKSASKLKSSSRSWVASGSGGSATSGSPPASPQRKGAAGPARAAVASGEHETETGWSLWYSENLALAETAEDYTNAMRCLGTFHTLEEFWRHYVHLKRPSELPAGSNLYMFRERLFPSWEGFPRGGCWILKISRGDEAKGVSSKIWQDLLFSTIGEAFEEPDVVGVCLAARPQHEMISVWNAENHNEFIRFNIGNKMKEILDLDPATIVNYKFHVKSVYDGSTYKGGKAYSFST